MAGTKEIKSRIKSVKSTRQITKAMEIVSTTKFKRFSKLVSESKPYEESMKKILFNISADIKRDRHPLFDGREEVKTIAILVMTSDRGLCGGFNNLTLKALEKIRVNNPGKKFRVIAIGKKGVDYSHKKKYIVDKSYTKVEKDTMSAVAKDISEEIVKLYNDNKYDEVYIIYNRFISALRSDLISERIIPIQKIETEERSHNYIFEPSKEYILSALLPRFLNVQVYQALLNNVASEHSARKNAMTNATESADDMIKSLNIKYNRNRQAAITQEITEIVSGAAAL